MMPKTVNPDPAMHRRRVRTELRNMREAAGMTQRDVARAMDWSQSKLIRIESGAVNVSTNDLRALLGHYGVDPARIDTLVGIARAARESTRWSVYKDVASPEFMAFLGYESSASIIRNFEPLIVPGLLQTEEYARTIISFLFARSPDKIDTLVDLRMQRQELFEREPPVESHFIIDEAVIRRMMGGRDVMRGQLRYLQGIVEGYSNITIQIVPFKRGMYRRQRGAYWLLEFPDPQDEYVLYVEAPQGEYIIREGSLEGEGKESPVHYMADFCELEQSLNHEDTLRLLQDAINRLGE
jgi:transcriptional regulator with XRE-family HTH domain